MLVAGRALQNSAPWPLTLSQPYAQATAIFLNKFNAGNFNRNSDFRGGTFPPTQFAARRFEPRNCGLGDARSLRQIGL